MSAVMLMVLAATIVGVAVTSKFATEYIFAAHRHGKTVLKRELRKAGVEPKHLGDDCLDALVAQSAEIPRRADYYEGRRFWRLFKTRLRETAAQIAAILAGDEHLSEAHPLYHPLKNAGAV
jgi:hypothetical protein